MKETQLSSQIDYLAEQKAKQFLNDLEKTILKTLEPYWRPVLAKNQWIGDDIKKIFNRIAVTDKPSISPSREMISHFRDKIISDVLDSLPAMQELLKLSENKEIV